MFSSFTGPAFSWCSMKNMLGDGLCTRVYPVPQLCVYLGVLWIGDAVFRQERGKLGPRSSSQHLAWLVWVFCKENKFAPKVTCS